MYPSAPKDLPLLITTHCLTRAHQRVCGKRTQTPGYPSWVCTTARQHYLRIHEKCRGSGPKPDLLHQTLHFSKTPRGCVDILRFRKHVLRIGPPTPRAFSDYIALSLSALYVQAAQLMPKPRREQGIPPPSDLPPPHPPCLLPAATGVNSTASGVQTRLHL